MPPCERAPRSAYRPNSHSSRSTNACGHKPKKQFAIPLIFSLSQKLPKMFQKLFFLFGGVLGSFGLKEKFV